jgi:AraC-like DNA-binding protein
LKSISMYLPSDDTNSTSNIPRKSVLSSIRRTASSGEQRMFPGGVRFDAEGTFVYLPSRALAQRRSGADPPLLDHLQNLALEQYSASSTEDDWTTRVRSALCTETTPLSSDARVVAGQLGVSVRGLGRNLAREGSTLKALMAEALYERAQDLLRRQDATAAQVAEMLGYAEVSSFFRAFRRWSGGVTPSTYRRSVGSSI